MQYKRKAVFLDRDGVLIQERGDYTWLLEDMKVNDGIAESLRKISVAGFMLIVISNQGGIGKELYTKSEADFLHHQLQRFLLSKGVMINEFYYCPHHPDTSNCLCRKPGSLMLEKAMARFNIDPEKSWFIGDADRDIEAGIKAGVGTIKIEPNASLLQIAEDIISGGQRLKVKG